MLRNLLSVWTNFQTDTSKHLEIKSGKLSRGKGMSVKKLKLDVSCQLRDVYTRFQVHISEHVEKRSEKILVAWSSAETPPPPPPTHTHTHTSECLWLPKGQKLPSRDENQYS